MINANIKSQKKHGFLICRLSQILFGLCLCIIFATILRPTAVFAQATPHQDLSPISLKLRIHIMRDISFQARGQGVRMTNDHITPAIVRDAFLGEVNKIWAPSGIVWVIESIIEEKANKPADFDRLKSIVEQADRDHEGSSDNARLNPLYQFMDPRYKSSSSNLFHIYIFPFIGNRSQGNAMRVFGFHTVVGSWSNKHNKGGVPSRRLYTESHHACVLGSLARTIAHELGHVLGMKHNDCKQCLMSSDCGYTITSSQIRIIRAEAWRRQ